MDEKKELQAENRPGLISEYPDGYEYIKKEVLTDLPEDNEIRDKYMISLIGTLLRS